MRCWPVLAISLAACQLVTGTDELEVVAGLDIAEIGEGGSDGAGGTAGMPGAADGGSGGAHMPTTPTANIVSPSKGCIHSECKFGAPLPASCSDCTAAVCLLDPFCCDVEWDKNCLYQVTVSCPFECPE